MSFAVLIEIAPPDVFAAGADALEFELLPPHAATSIETPTINAKPPSGSRAPILRVIFRS
jgi:hypothetical protein